MPYHRIREITLYVTAGAAKYNKQERARIFYRLVELYKFVGNYLYRKIGGAIAGAFERERRGQSASVAVTFAK